MIELKKWQSIADAEEFKRLMHDPYLSKKYNRAKRLVDKLAYIKSKTPEVLKPGARVLDIGPGPGEYLEVCRELGAEIQGIDAMPGHCEMGEPYLRLSQLMTRRQGVPVAYTGLAGFTIPAEDGFYTVVNSQGSIEQVFKDHLLGPPHRETKKAALLSWNLTPTLTASLDRFLCEVCRVLKEGGVFVVWANGAKNVSDYDRLITERARMAGFELIAERKQTFHKWRKPVSSGRK